MASSIASPSWKDLRLDPENSLWRLRPNTGIVDEYDAAQERGEVFGKLRSREELTKPTAADIGLSRKEIHEARIIRDAEVAEPGICAPQDLRRDAVISPSVCHELAPRVGDFQLYGIAGSGRCTKRRNVTSRQAWPL